MANIFSEEINRNIETLQYAIAGRQNSVFLNGNLNAESFQKLMILLQYEYPQIITIFPNEQLLYENNQINLIYNNFDENLFYQKLNELQFELQKKIGYCNDEYQIVKTVYDYITSTMEYDHEAFSKANRYNEIVAEYNRSNKTPNQKAAFFDETRRFNEETGTAHSMYGPVVHKKGVCSGLSQLFKFLLNSYNIEVQCILGNLKGVGDHAVTAVRVNGEWGIIDIASGMKNVSSLNVSLYHYFMLSMDEYNEIFTPRYEEYNLIETVNHLNFYKKYNLEFNNICQLSAFFNNLIGYTKEKIIYCKYTGNALEEKDITKMAEKIILSKLTDKFTIGNIIISEKKLSLKIEPRKR